MPRFYKSTSLLILFLFLALHLNLYATNYYIDKFATGNNNGTSWTNAWESFADINWSQIQPGDLIYISGGSSSTVYFETLSISGVSGSSGNPIIIRSGIDAGHNGEVIIDGQESRSRGVDMSDVNYITVEHLTIKSCTYAGGIVEEPATNIIFQNLKVLNHFRAGLYFKGTSSNYTALSNCAMRNNTLESTTNYGGSQTDNIYMQYVHDIEISGNHIEQLNTAADIHSDCIQFAYVGSFEVFNNYCYNTRWEHSQGIIIQFQRSGTTQKLYNNILDCANLNGTAAIQIGYQDQSNITTYIYGNTVYAGSSPFGIGAYNPDAIVRNNILYSNVSDGGVLYFANTLTSTSQCSNNLFYTPNDNDVVRMNGTKYTLSEWQAIGGGAGSYDSDPNFHNMNSGDFTIDEPSNAIDNGIVLGAPYDKDIIGTLRPQGSGWDFGVYELTTRGGDITPPEVTGATLLDTVTLKITFSEPLDPITAQNISNYSINNGITIFNATLSTDIVTLSTSTHSPGTYTVTVNNVEDLAGNTVDPSANTANYELIEPSDMVSVNLKILLEGPYGDNQMKPDLNTLNFIPNDQPYNTDPWNYTGNENINVIPPGVVDWILIEIRSSTTASSIVARHAAFVATDGSVLNFNGEPLVQFNGVSTGYYYLVVHHRNHLPIMSKNPLHLSEISELYDFTLSQNKAYGNQPMKELDNGKFGLYSADGNASGNINNADHKSIWRRQNGSIGYKSGDYDMNGGVNIKDKNARYKQNKGKNTGVPL